jgi:hypothetical protein
MVTFSTTRPEIPETAWLCGRAGPADDASRRACQGRHQVAETIRGTPELTIHATATVGDITARSL